MGVLWVYVFGLLQFGRWDVSSLARSDTGERLSPHGRCDLLLTFSRLERL